MSKIHKETPPTPQQLKEQQKKEELWLASQLIKADITNRQNLMQHYKNPKGLTKEERRLFKEALKEKQKQAALVINEVTTEMNLGVLVAWDIDQVTKVAQEYVRFALEKTARLEDLQQTVSVLFSVFNRVGLLYEVGIVHEAEYDQLREHLMKVMISTSIKINELAAFDPENPEY
jgi:hypothetical protein